MALLNYIIVDKIVDNTLVWLIPTYNVLSTLSTTYDKKLLK